MMAVHSRGAPSLFGSHALVHSDPPHHEPTLLWKEDHLHHGTLSLSLFLLVLLFHAEIMVPVETMAKSIDSQDTLLWRVLDLSFA